MLFCKTKKTEKFCAYLFKVRAGSFTNLGNGTRYNSLMPSFNFNKKRKKINILGNMRKVELISKYKYTSNARKIDGIFINI